MRPRNDPTEARIHDLLLSAVQTYAEDTGCGEITIEFLDRAAAEIADGLHG